MKQILFVLMLGMSLSAFSQTNADLSKLKANRQFLAQTDFVYPYIDSPPFYPGGGEKWNRYVMSSSVIKKAIEDAKAQNMPAGNYTVIVKFAIGADSTVQDVKTINKTIGYGLEAAAIELVKGSGKWIPANIEGNDTKAFLNLPVNFAIRQ
jgi:hypothetical protein